MTAAKQVKRDNKAWYRKAYGGKSTAWMSYGNVPMRILVIQNHKFATELREKERARQRG